MNAYQAKVMFVASPLSIHANVSLGFGVSVARMIRPLGCRPEVKTFDGLHHCCVVLLGGKTVRIEADADSDADPVDVKLYVPASLFKGDPHGIDPVEIDSALFYAYAPLLHWLCQQNARIDVLKLALNGKK